MDLKIIFLINFQQISTFDFYIPMLQNKPDMLNNFLQYCPSQKFCTSYKKRRPSEIINAQLPQNVLAEEAMKICEYCFLEVLKLKDKTDQKETDSVINALYARWCKVKIELQKCCHMLPNHTREPIVFKVTGKKFYRKI